MLTVAGGPALWDGEAFDNGSALFEPASLLQPIDPDPRDTAIMKTKMLKPRMICLSVRPGSAPIPFSAHTNQFILPSH